MIGKTDLPEVFFFFLLDGVSRAKRRAWMFGWIESCGKVMVVI